MDKWFIAWVQVNMERSGGYARHLRCLATDTSLPGINTLLLTFSDYRQKTFILQPCIKRLFHK